MGPPSDDSARPSDPADRLLEYGWIIESLPSGGVRMRTGAALRGCTLGCSFGLLLLLGLFASFMYFVGGKLREGVPDDAFLQVAVTLFWLALLGTLGLAVVAVVVQIVWLLFVREEWEAGANRLEIRRRLLGVSRSRHYQNGALILEPNYQEDKVEPFWRLAVKSDGQKHYLIRETTISDRGTAIGFESRREEAEAVADLVAQHTGWPVTSAEREAAEAVQSTAERLELPAELRRAGFRAGVDEQLRLTIRLPTRGRLVFGIVLVLLGCGWTALLADGAKSLVQHGAQQPLADLPFVFVMALMLMAGVLAAVLGVVIIFGRDRWLVGHNLFIVRSRLFGWKSEQQFVDGTFSLTRVSRITSEAATVWSWELQLQNQAGRTLKGLRSDRDDDVPRLLGSLLSQCTGWPLREAES